MQHVKIRSDLFLVHSSSKGKTSAPAANTNHLWLFDRSGSMYDLLHNLIHDLKDLVRTLKQGDTVTLGWFSGPGEYNYIVKGFKIAGDADFVTLDKMLDRHDRTVGTTCFSEILTSTKQVVEDLSVFSSTFSLVFLTDGYPTVANYNKEVATIFNAVTDLRGSIPSALLVGYGNYYNRPLMTEISEKLGAALTHSEGIKDLRSAVDGFLKDSSKGAKVKLALDIPYAPGTFKYPVAFSLAESGVNILAQEPNVVYAPEGEDVYILSNVCPAGSVEVTPKEKDVRHISSSEALIRGVYGVSYLLCQLGKTDQAMEALATLGDVYLIDALTNAYTPSEYGVAEKKILHAINNHAGRYFKGYKKNYLPPADAYCLLDVLDELLDDEQAMFYPYHSAFDYKRIGVKDKVVEDMPKWRPDYFAGVPISSLTWNSTMLNLSVLAKIDGKVHLAGEAKKYGFSEEYPTWVYRNYALIKDGFLNVKTLPVSLSEHTFDKLQSKTLIDSTEKYTGSKGIYEIHLDNVPVINRAMAEGKTSATALADKVRREYELKGMLKALRYFKEVEVGEEVEKVGVFASLNDDQVSYLEANHIGKNGFAPKVVKSESTDFYRAKEFSIKVKGLSSFPKVSDVQNKVATNKKLTVSDLFVKAGIDLYDQSGIKNQDKAVRIAWLSSKIDSLLKEQRTVSRDIQETKFSILLAKKWLDEFPSREDNKLVVGGYDFTFSLREVSVPI